MKANSVLTLMVVGILSGATLVGCLAKAEDSLGLSPINSRDFEEEVTRNDWSEPVIYNPVNEVVASVEEEVVTPYSDEVEECLTWMQGYITTKAYSNGAPTYEEFQEGHVLVQAVLEGYGVDVADEALDQLDNLFDDEGYYIYR